MTAEDRDEPGTEDAALLGHTELCCAPMRPGSRPLQTVMKAEVHTHTTRVAVELQLGRMAMIPGGSFEMGGDAGHGFPADGELPIHPVEVSPFAIDVHATSNREFARFTAATGYRTDAERAGWSFVFHALLPATFPPTRAIAGAPWWRQVEGASWRAPEGAGSSVHQRMDHPAVHISWHDASAYAHWAGKRLPTEAEWEYAARGGLARARYPWGDALTPDGQHRCNIWQGRFPTQNTAEDGYVGTAPVDAFPPNGFGLYNMAGNVWEWCMDWFERAYYQISPAVDPKGPAIGLSKVIRGGSYLCHASYCTRYRVGARSQNTPDSSSGNTGFRCAADV